MSFEHSLEKGVQFGFVPRHLEIKERPELSVFPFNVFFAQYGARDGKPVVGSTVYEPDLASFRQEGDKYSMDYHNVHGGKSWLVIEYDPFNKSYLGEKFVNGESAGMATGSDWKMFFVHFTALGLSNGERCKFEDIKQFS